MPHEEARYEYRVFAQNFGLIEEKIRRIAAMEEYRDSREIYIISETNDKNNSKIRDGQMDIKTLVGKDAELEYWDPGLRKEFPLSADFIKANLVPAFQVSGPVYQREIYTADQFINEIVTPHPQLVAVHVYKRREKFLLARCIAEIAEVYINGAKLMTAALEAVDAGIVREGLRHTGLDAYENVNYLLAIKRVIGMKPLPGDSIYKAL